MHGQRVERFDRTPGAVLLRELRRRNREERQHHQRDRNAEEDERKAGAPRVEDGKRQGGEREQLDRGAQRDLGRRLGLPAPLERQERQDYQRCDQGVALRVLQRQEQLEIHERQGDDPRATGQETHQGVVEQQRVQQVPGEQRERERQLRERQEEQGKRRAVLVEVHVLAGMGRVQIGAGEQIDRRPPEHGEVVGLRQHALLDRDQNGTRRVQRQQPAAGASRHVGRELFHARGAG